MTDETNIAAEEVVATLVEIAPEVAPETVETTPEVEVVKEG
jgi:hypothetical protein